VYSETLKEFLYLRLILCHFCIRTS